MESSHIPVLLKEVMEALQLAKSKRVLDATFGRGGHTRAMLAAGAEVVALDQDHEAELCAQALLKEFPQTFTFRRANFSDLGELAAELGEFDGVLMDLGVSSPQLDVAERGFSFQQDGPLDMRMNQESATTAADLIAAYGEEELANIIFRFGDEMHARKIARAIVNARAKEKITRTTQLATIVEKAIGGRRGSKIHPATKTFQALRIATNDELSALQHALQAVPCVLKKYGRVGVISFHSLEDRMVKEFIARCSSEEIRSTHYAFGQPNPDFSLKKIGRWLPSQDEINANPRARSARLRVAEKII